PARRAHRRDRREPRARHRPALERRAQERRGSDGHAPQPAPRERELRHAGAGAADEARPAALRRGAARTGAAMSAALRWSWAVALLAAVLVADLTGCMSVPPTRHYAL